MLYTLLMKGLIIKLNISHHPMISLFPFIQKASAAAITPIGNPDNVPSNGDIISTISNVGGGVLEILWLLGGIFAIGFILYGGLLYITAGGDMDKVKKARITVINAAIGVVLLISTYAIIRLAASIGTSIDTWIN